MTQFVGFPTDYYRLGIQQTIETLVHFSIALAAYIVANYGKENKRYDLAYKNDIHSKYSL